MLLSLFNYIYSIYHTLFGKKWYIIEGNIGCGKTTLIRQLKSRDDFEVIEEPVEVWKSIVNEEFIQQSIIRFSDMAKSLTQATQFL